ncbi:hypothetical protein [Haloferula sp. BvORR071]|uniref:hypothetical protein n=1 Tax=Haloferula sp. BvORR071 TaxID=1396141 RepID=UPI0005582328|nr:hypothetical protein [Haloferula sp. BvORR071]
MNSRQTTEYTDHTEGLLELRRAYSAAGAVLHLDEFPFDGLATFGFPEGFGQESRICRSGEQVGRFVHVLAREAWRDFS